METLLTSLAAFVGSVTLMVYLRYRRPSAGLTALFLGLSAIFLVLGVLSLAAPETFAGLWSGLIPGNFTPWMLTVVLLIFDARLVQTTVQLRQQSLVKLS